MKKIAVFLIITFSLIVAGCSQSTKATNSTAATDKESQTKSDFPKQPIQMILPYSPGSSTEMIARIVAGAAEKHLNGQPIVIVNKPGGSGTIGSTELFRAKPDGYTLGMLSNNQFSIQPNFGKTVYSHDSFQPIIKVSVVPQLLAVKADAPWKTFEEFMDFVKQNPEQFTYATVGAGSTVHISVEALNTAAGVKTKAVHFEGGSQQVTAVLGGHTLGASLLPQTAKEYVNSGRIRILANLGSFKPEAYKDVPLLSEKGIDAAVDVYNGFLAPKETPKEIVDILHNAFKKALEEPEVIKQLKNIDVNAAYAGPEDFQKEITESYNQYGEILRAIGLVK